MRFEAIMNRVNFLMTCSFSVFSYYRTVYAKQELTRGSEIEPSMHSMPKGTLKDFKDGPFEGSLV